MATPLDILIVDDEPNIRRTLELHFEGEGHRVRTAANPREALDALDDATVDVAFVDLRLGTDSGIDLIADLRARAPRLPVVIITAHGTLDTAIEAMKLGVREYVRKPFKPPELDLVLERLSELDRLERRYRALEEDLQRRDPGLRLESESPVMREVLRAARRVAGSDTPLLLEGPSGSGKGVLAREVHRWSPRHDRPFVVVPCPALPRELLESELFGHVKGAFTGASRDRDGRVAMAEGGTLLLDEVGDLPLELQPKLLRFIEDRTYERVGESSPREADVRIIAATNHDLEAGVEEGGFREDLFYRLSVVRLEVPALAARREDVLHMARHFLDFFSRRHDRPGLVFTDEGERALVSHSWPGNVRELRNAVERAVLLAEGVELGPAELGLPGPGPGGADGTDGAVRVRIGDHVRLDAVEEAHIRQVLATTDSYREAAEVLGIDEATLWRRRKKYGMEEA